MAELGTRRTTERVRTGNSPPTAARAVLLPDQGANPLTVSSLPGLVLMHHYGTHKENELTHQKPQP